MKIRVNAIGIAAGILWALWVFWGVMTKILGFGSVPFEFMDQMYLGWLKPTFGGAIFGLILGFIDGYIAGVIFAWIYNKIAKKSK